MVKIFIGNLPRIATKEEIKELFEKYGKLTECDIIKNYGFVHMEDKEAADEAIKNLHHHKLHGLPINVEASKSKLCTERINGPQQWRENMEKESWMLQIRNKLML